jgi:integrase
MSKKNFTSPTSPKPPRPAGAVLFWHPSGRWCKKIRGKQHYFGNQSYTEALARYEQVKDDLLSGRVLPIEPEILTVELLCQKLLSHKLSLTDAGELSVRSLRWYREVCQLLCDQFGKKTPVADLKPDDFGRLRTWMTKRWGPVRRGNFVNGTKIVFNFGLKTGLLDRLPIYGEFQRPSKKTIRQHRQAQGPKMFEAHEVRLLLDNAPVPLKTMILLGINCGYGNADCAKLPLRALDLTRGCLDFPRPKTAVPRRCPLWPETVQALEAWLQVRPTPRREEHQGLVFITKFGGSWLKPTSDNPLSNETGALMKSLGLNGGRNFYALRHTFRTIADEVKDQPAADLIMGHESPHMSSAYRERIDNRRLLDVTNHVRQWLFDLAEGSPATVSRQDVLPMVKIG